MKGFYISGGNGSIVQLEDGRWADTVLGQTSENKDSHEALDELFKEITKWQAAPLFGDFNVERLEKYVGA